MLPTEIAIAIQLYIIQFSTKNAAKITINAITTLTVSHIFNL